MGLDYVVAYLLIGDRSYYICWTGY